VVGEVTLMCMLCMCLSVVCSVVSQDSDSVFDFVEPALRPVISSAESEEENIYDRPPPARG